MRGVMIAAAIGAATSVLLFIGFTFGVAAYFRVVSWRETRQAMRSA